VIRVQTITELRSAVKKLMSADVAVPALVISSWDASPSTCLTFSSVAAGRPERLRAVHQVRVRAERGAQHPEEREQGDDEQDRHRRPGGDPPPRHTLLDPLALGASAGHLRGRSVD
jgi:hypothetical protein